MRDPDGNWRDEIMSKELGIRNKRSVLFIYSGIKKEYHFTSLKQTERFAHVIARRLRGGDVIALQGELGAGKTTFVQMLARALGVKGRVTSPTFVLMNLYALSREAQKKGITALCHIDAYRMRSSREFEAIGVQDYLGARGTVTLVEWADRVKKLMPRSAYWIAFRIIA